MSCGLQLVQVNDVYEIDNWPHFASARRRVAGEFPHGPTINTMVMRMRLLWLRFYSSLNVISPPSAPSYIPTAARGACGASGDGRPLVKTLGLEEGRPPFEPSHHFSRVPRRVLCDVISFCEKGPAFLEQLECVGAPRYPCS